MKKNFIKEDKLIVIFSEIQGKIPLIAKGIKSITSKRISHLETGNYIRFSYTRNEGYATAYLNETELVYGYSKIKENNTKVHVLYRLVFILNQLLPENQENQQIFLKTLSFLKQLNNSDTINDKDLQNYLKSILIIGGYVNEAQIEDEYFNPERFIEELIQKKIILPSN
jgi:DNA repair protein RecO